MVRLKIYNIFQEIERSILKFLIWAFAKIPSIFLVIEVLGFIIVLLVTSVVVKALSPSRLGEEVTEVYLPWSNIYPIYLDSMPSFMSVSVVHLAYIRWLFYFDRESHVTHHIPQHTTTFQTNFEEFSPMLLFCNFSKRLKILFK